jgi:hypothetical protein
MATNRYLEAFNQFATQTGNRREKAREFAIDTMTKLFDQHLDDKDTAEALINTGASIAAVPEALKQVRNAARKVGARVSDSRAMRTSFEPNRVGEPADESGTEMQIRKFGQGRRIVDEPAGGGGEFGESSRAVGPQEGMSVAESGQVVDDAFSGSSAARATADSTGRLVGRIGSNVANISSKVGESVSQGTRAVGNAISTAADTAEQIASGAADAVGGAARAVVGDAAVDAIVGTAGAVSEVAGPLSLLALLGVGVYDLVKAVTRPKINTNITVPINTQRAAIVAPSNDSTLQQSSVAGAF